MRLRTGLLLLFGLVLLAFSGVVAYANGTARHLVRKQIEKSLSARGFRRLELDRQVLLDSEGAEFEHNRGTVENRDAFITAEGDFNKWLLRDGATFEQVLKVLRSPRGPNGKEWDLGQLDPDKLQDRSTSKGEAWVKCRARLLNLWSDTMLGILMTGRERDQEDSPLDLLLITDRKYEVLAEQSTLDNGSPPEASEIIPEPHLNAQARAMIDQAVQGDPGSRSIDYMVYGDGNLYLTVVRRLELGGVVVLGSRVDQRFLSQASQVAGEGIYARVVVGGEHPHVVGTDDTISADLLKLAHPSTASPAPAPAPSASGESVGPSPAQEASLGGYRYLVSQRPLGVGRDPVAWIYFLRPLTEVESEQDAATRTIAIAASLVFLACVVAIIWLTGRVTRPIESLSYHMVLVGQGDLKQQAEVRGSLEVAQAAESFNQMVRELRQKEEAMKFLPQQTREEIASTTSQGIQLGGQRIKATILFSDLRGFTSLSERLTPQAVLAILNEYLNLMTATILSHHGDVNEFIGDAILAVFREQDGARQAVAAALDMDEALKQLKLTTTSQDLREMNQGMGIHTGELVAGNIGTQERKKGAVIGDTVNLAARIQDRSRQGKHTSILVSDATRADLGEDFELELFGDEEFEGKSAPVRVWEVVGRAQK